MSNTEKDSKGFADSVSSASGDPAPHTLTVEEAERQFQTSIERGLTQAEADRRHEIYGPNRLDTEPGISIVKVVLHQVCNAMILVLIISMCIAFGIRDWISGGVIGFVIFLNVFVGVIQEYSAAKTMDSLKSLSSPNARVIRDGNDTTIPSEYVVPGDIVLVKVGDTIPADFRVVDCMNFETDEALLTGESMPVNKRPDKVFAPDTPVGDRINLAFSSSVVVKGRATGIVASIGMNTEIGVIAQSLKGTKKRYRAVERREDGSASPLAFLKSWALTCWDLAGNFLGLNVGTPLQRRLSKLAIALFFVAVLWAIVVMAAQKFDVTKQVGVYAIAVALSMIPSSLVVVLTITLAVGAKVMVTRNVVVRKLDSLEALGAVNDICSDKTGTLTQGKMVARKVWVPTLGTYTVSDTNEPFNPTKGLVSFVTADPVDEAESEETPQPPPLPHPELFLDWIRTATLANIAVVKKDTDDSGAEVWRATGDPTEIAIQVFVTRLGFPRSSLTEGPNAAYTHLAEYPFDSSIKRMSAVYKHVSEGSTHVFTKGAVERVLACCSHWYGTSEAEKEAEKSGNATVHPLTPADIAAIEANMNSLSKEGLRVLAFATKTVPPAEADSINWETVDRKDVETNLTFLGLVGIYDPPRPESAGAVKKCHKAGINVHMLTGDHPGTASAIAQEVGILPRNLYHYTKEVVDAMVMTAPQFDALSDEQIDALPVLPLVIARCAPTTKVRMIDALHRRRAFSAMTGDGVNDSPSLKRADVGIAMGIAGSDVAKDASDIVLSDDNFASILNAVEEGRRMSDNIQKFVLHLLSGNVGQAIFLLCGLAFKDSTDMSVFPLSPVEVLWIIMVTSAFPAMGLGLEKASPDTMIKPPKSADQGIFTWEILVDMICWGVWMAILCLVAFIIVVYGKGNGELGYQCNERYSEACKYVFRGRSTAFVVMTWSCLFLAWEVIDSKRSLFAMHPDTDTPYTQVFRDLWDNQFLFWSVMGGFITVFPVIYIPVINHKVFLHGAISWEWGVAFGLGVFGFILGAEAYKWGKRRYFRHLGTVRAHNPEYDLERNTPFAKYASFSRAPTLEPAFV